MVEKNQSIVDFLCKILPNLYYALSVTDPVVLVIIEL